MGIDKTSRAQGCLLGQLAGDALGSLVEFSPRERYGAATPMVFESWRMAAHGIPLQVSRPMIPRWRCLLARMLVKTGSYEPEAAQKEY